MKSAIAGLALLGTAGGLGMILPDAAAPYRVGHVTLAESARDAGLQLSTYAAATRMTRADVTAWAERRGVARGVRSVMLVFPPGSPVPDLRAVANRQDADWVAARAAPLWRIDIEPDGARIITQTGMP